MMPHRIEASPPALAGWPPRLEVEGERLVYDFAAAAGSSAFSSPSQGS